VTGADPRPSRRRLLASLGSGSALGIAGCLSSIGRDGDGGSDTWAAGGPADREGWSVTFAEQFDGGELDTDVWSVGAGRAPMRCPDREGPNYCYLEDNVFVEDDRLVLEATEETPAIPQAEQPRETPPPAYSSGAVNTESGFEQEYGYFEAKTRVDAAPGTNPAFWLFINLDLESWREINVEWPGAYGGRLTDVGIVYDRGQWDVQRHNHEHTFSPPTDETFHVWGIEWTPERVAVDLNGERIVVDEGDYVGEHLPGRPLYVVLDFAVFEAAQWVGDPAEAEFPLRFETEWVRTWQREEWR